MIKIQTSHIKDFLTKASRIPANKFLAISEYILLEGEPHVNQITLTYTGSGATVRQSFGGSVKHKTSFLLETRALSVIIQNGDELQVLKGEDIIMTCGGNTMTMSIVNDVDYTSLVEDVTGEPVRLKEDAIKAIKSANILCPAPDGKINPNMTAVHLSPNNAGCEIMATNSYSLLVQQTDLPITSNHLFSKEMCSCISLYSEVDLYEHDNKYIVVANNTEYAFLKPELNFVKAYKDILQSANDAEHIGFIDKNYIIAFCEQSGKLTTNKSFDVTLSAKDGRCNLSMKDEYLAVSNNYELSAELKDVEIKFQPELILNGFKAMPSDAVELHEGRQYAIFKSENATFLFTKKS